MGKIRDWFIHMLGGTTDDEYNTVVNANTVRRNGYNKSIRRNDYVQTRYNSLHSKS